MILLKSSIVGAIENEFEHMGMMDTRRCIHVFYEMDKYGKEISLGTQIFVKVILLNITSVKSSNIMFEPTQNKGNGVVSNINVYTLSGTMPCGVNNASFGQSLLVLETSRKLSRDTNFDINYTTKFTAPFYNKTIGQQSIRDGLFQIEAFSDIDTKLPPPKYYTSEHQYTDINTVDDIIDMAGEQSYIGSELVDNFTEIYFRDMKEYKTMFDHYAEKSRVNRYKPNSDEAFVGDVNMFTGMDNFIGGGVISYDSGDDQWNMTGMSIPNKKFISEQGIADEIDSLVDSITTKAQHIASEFGEVRVMYHPSFIGSKMKIYYKDYAKNNQPRFGTEDKNGIFNIDAANEMDDYIHTRIDQEVMEQETLSFNYTAEKVDEMLRYAAGAMDI